MVHYIFSPLLKTYLPTYIFPIFHFTCLGFLCHIPFIVFFFFVFLFYYLPNHSDCKHEINEIILISAPINNNQKHKKTSNQIQMSRPRDLPRRIMAIRAFNPSTSALTLTNSTKTDTQTQAHKGCPSIIIIRQALGLKAFLFYFQSIVILPIDMLD